MEEGNTRLSLFEISPVLIPYLLGFFVFRGVFVNFPIYIQITQGLSEIETVNIWAIISGVALLVGALTRIPAGLISDKIGRIQTYYLSYFIYATALVVILLVTSNILYVFLLSFIRFGLNLIVMTGRAIVSISKRDRALKNGLLSSMVGLGSFSGPYLMGFILDHYPPDYFILATIGIVIIDFLIFLILSFVVHRSLSSMKIESDLHTGIINSSERVNYRKSVSSPQIREIIVLFFFSGLIFGFISSIYSIYGFNVIGLSPTSIGFVVGGGSLVQAIWAPIVGKLYNRVKDEYLLLFSWVFVVLAALLASLSSLHVLLFIVSFIVLNFGNAGFYTIEITRISRLVQKHEFSFVFGLATSLVILGTSIAGFLSPVLYSILPEANFMAALIFAIIGLVMIIYLIPSSLKRFHI